MKIIILLFLFSNLLFGQKGSFENPSNNILYSGIPNDLEFCYPEIDCDSLQFLSTNALINKKSCRLEIFPNDNTELDIFVYKKNKGDSTLIDTRRFRIKPIPQSELSIGGVTSGSIRKNYLIAQQGILITNPLNIDFNYNKLSYEFLLIRNGKVKQKLTSKNFRFTKIELNFLNFCKSKDVLLIFNINVVDRNQKKVKINPIQLDIAD